MVQMIPAASQGCICRAGCQYYKPCSLLVWVDSISIYSSIPPALNSLLVHVLYSSQCNANPSHLCSGADAYEVAYSKICIQHVIVGLDIQAIITGLGLWRGPWDQAGESNLHHIQIFAHHGKGDKNQDARALEL